MLRANSAVAVDSLLMDWLARAIPARKCARKRDCGADRVWPSRTSKCALMSSRLFAQPDFGSHSPDFRFLLGTQYGVRRRYLPAVILPFSHPLDLLLQM